MSFHFALCLIKRALITGTLITVVLLLLTLVFFICIKYYIRTKKKRLSSNKLRIAFFHPYCNAGGGGEKVLWCMLKALSENFKDKNLELAIFTGDLEADETILQKAKDRFNLKFSARIEFIRVPGRSLIAPKGFLTVFFQILGTIIYAVKAIYIYPPDIFFDTTGLAFSFVAVKHILPATKIGAYVHYPFVSYEMLEKVENNKASFNNSSRIADSKILSKGKIFYYRFSIYLYEKMGNYLDFLYTNSTWTDNHIRRLWRKWTTSTNILYPPCNVSNFLAMPSSGREKVMLSFAQFRPEKNHELQLRVFRRIQNDYPEGKDLKFMIIGSCRGGEDEVLLNNLKKKVSEMQLTNVSFQVNLSYEDLLKCFSKATIGIHTMEAEHFGIAIVEMISAGLAVITHNSAGPRYDIIKERASGPIGFLCLSEDEYVESILKVLRMDEKYRTELVQRGREEMKRFSDEAFINHFTSSFRNFISV